MEKFASFAIFAENLKSFGIERQGFDVIKNINLIAGRNNSGKSSLIDLIEYAVDGTMQFPDNHWHDKKACRVITETKFNEEDNNFFPRNHSGGQIGGNHYNYGQCLLGAKLVTQINGRNRGTLLACEPLHPISGQPQLMDLGNYKQNVENSSQRNSLQGYKFYRLAAERNIVPEPDGEIGIDSTGVGATNLIQCFANKSYLPSDLVETTLLNSLNKIFAPDAIFTDIVCQHHKDSYWEIFLEEQGKGRIALSQSGSGLKTVILVLCYIHLLPAFLKEPLSNFVFAFEELENNLHPALQRRLLTYVTDLSIKENFPVFFTTHSSVAIDMFSKRDDAQIIHVTHNGKFASAKRITTYIESTGILDDLDLRASDLLQANGIIWVEGPSDRIYLNRWIELVSAGKISERVHYQCIFYGGRLLSHLSADSLDHAYDGIALLTINRNAAIIIDSDKRNEEDELNGTKTRILKEFKKFSGFTWVTSGREIENYIPDSLLRKWIPPSLPPKTQKNKFNSFFSHLNRIQTGLGEKFEGKKPLLAEQMMKLMTIDDLKERPELLKKIEELCNRIRQWNRMHDNIS